MELQLLESYEIRKANVTSFADNLEKKIVAAGMTADLDQEVTKFIIAVKTTKKDFYEKRIPITKKLNEVIKAFTTQEKDLDDIAAKMQAYRDDFVKKLALEQQKEEEQRQKESLKTIEKIEIKEKIKEKLSIYVNDELTKLKTAMVKALHTVTKDNIDEKQAKLKMLNTQMHHDLIPKFVHNVTSIHGNDVEVIRNEVIAEIGAQLAVNWSDEIKKHQEECLYHIEMIKVSDTNDYKARLESKKQELENESIEAAKKIEDQSVLTKEMQIAVALMGSIAEDTETLPEVRKSYKIKVLNNAGWAQICAFWTAKVLPGYDFDRVGKKSFDSMIVDIERLDERIESENVVYEETFKAVNRK